MPYAPTVRARFRTDPAAQQQGFLRAFLTLHDQDTDVTHLPGATAAADWLRSRRVHRGRHRLVLVDDVDSVGVAQDLAAIETDLRAVLEELVAASAAAYQAGIAETKRTPWYAQRPLKQRPPDHHLPAPGRELALAATSALTASSTMHHAALVELLTALKVAPPTITLQALIVACRRLLDEALPWDPPPSVAVLMPRLEAARLRLTAIVDEALRRAC